MPLFAFCAPTGNAIHKVRTANMNTHLTSFIFFFFSLIL
ncbi:Uncharacterised protein [Segatella copri]|nr:Uncharacterised protein [Segatella copri]